MTKLYIILFALTTIFLLNSCGNKASKVDVHTTTTPVPEFNELKTPYDNSHVYGKWKMVGAIVIVYEKGKDCYMVNYYGGNNYGEPELFIKTEFQDNLAFENAEDPMDLYVINQNGDLEGYYNGELANTFLKSK